MPRGINLDGADDLAALDTLDEETMLEAICRRYEKDRIYVSIERKRKKFFK